MLCRSLASICSTSTCREVVCVCVAQSLLGKAGGAGRSKHLPMGKKAQISTCFKPVCTKSMSPYQGPAVGASPVTGLGVRPVRSPHVRPPCTGPHTWLKCTRENHVLGGGGAQLDTILPPLKTKPAYQNPEPSPVVCRRNPSHPTASHTVPPHPPVHASAC
jgi:hypothetical protein